MTSTTIIEDIYTLTIALIRRSQSGGSNFKAGFAQASSPKIRTLSSTYGWEDTSSSLF